MDLIYILSDFLKSTLASQICPWICFSFKYREHIEGSCISWRFIIKMQNYVPSGSNMLKSLYYKNMTDMNSSAICKLPCSTRELYGYLFILKVLLLCRTFLVSLSILTIEASGFFFLLPTLLQSTNGSCYLKQCYLFACNNRQRHLNFTCVFKHFSSDETIIMVT